MARHLDRNALTVVIEEIPGTSLPSSGMSGHNTPGWRPRMRISGNRHKVPRVAPEVANHRDVPDACHVLARPRLADKVSANAPQNDVAVH